MEEKKRKKEEAEHEKKYVCLIWLYYHKADEGHV